MITHAASRKQYTILLDRPVCYLLWLEKNVVYVVARNTLTKGTEAELEAFLITKCSLAKRKF